MQSALDALGFPHRVNESIVQLTVIRCVYGKRRLKIRVAPSASVTSSCNA